MSRSARIVAIAIAGTAAGIAAAIFTSGSTVADLAVLTAACVIGELVELRPAGRAPLPLSFAIVIVLGACGDARAVRHRRRRRGSARADRAYRAGGDRQPTGRRGRTDHRGSGRRRRVPGGHRIGCGWRPPRGRARRVDRGRRRRDHRCRRGDARARTSLRVVAQPCCGPRHHHERDPDGRRLRRHRGQGRPRAVGPVALLDPAARRLVLVRAARVDAAQLRTDRARAGGGTRARRSRARGARRTRRVARHRNGAGAEPLGRGSRPARDGGAAASPRRGLPRRARPGRRPRPAAGRGSGRDDAARRARSSPPPATSWRPSRSCTGPRDRRRPRRPRCRGWC